MRLSALPAARRRLIRAPFITKAPASHSHANYFPLVYNQQNLPSATGPVTDTSQLPGSQLGPLVSC